MKLDVKKLDIKKLLPIILFASVLLLIVGAFAFLRPPEPPHQFKTPQEEQTFKIENVPGISGVKRFSDANKNILNNTNRTRRSTRSTTTNRISAPLPYPRISINYTLSKVSSIREESAGDNSTFIVATLDIKNYGYRYFDAHPKMFRMVYRNTEFEPIVTVGTENVLDEVLPNNSMTKGDIVFLVKQLVKQKMLETPTIRYIEGGYTILYNQGNKRRRF